MLPSVKNKQTMEILKKLKAGGPPAAKGAPAPGSSVEIDIFSDMDGDEEALEAEGLGGEVTDMSMPGVMTPEKLRKKMKPSAKKPQAGY